jgi:hypothetical protein
MQIHDDIETLRKGCTEFLAIMQSEPEVDDFRKKGKAGEGKEGKIDMDAWSAATEAFNKRKIEFGRKNIRPLAEAGARVIGQFFLDIHSIADGVNK